jgi:hypothetical protein
LVLLSFFEILVFNEEVFLSLCFFCFVYFCFNQYSSSISTSSIRFKTTLAKPMLKDLLTKYQVKGNSIQSFQASGSSLVLGFGYSCSLDTTFLIKDLQLSKFFLDVSFNKSIFSVLSTYPFFLNVTSKFSLPSSLTNLTSELSLNDFNFFIVLLNSVKPKKVLLPTY